MRRYLSSLVPPMAHSQIGWKFCESCIQSTTKIILALCVDMKILKVKILKKFIDISVMIGAGIVGNRGRINQIFF